MLFHQITKAGFIVKLEVSETRIAAEILLFNYQEKGLDQWRKLI